MDRRKKIYEGKTKQLFMSEDPDNLIMHFKDDASAFNGAKRGFISKKGIISNKISNYIFRMLEKRGIPTHYVEELTGRETLIKKVDMIPVEVTVRNIAAGSFSRRFNIDEGTRLKKPILEYTLKDDTLCDPFINDYHIDALELATLEEMEMVAEYALLVNKTLRTYLGKLGVTLVDVKMEFGCCGGDILLADEISPDTCRFWDTETGEKLDKDRFRHELGDAEEAYVEILDRLSEAGDGEPARIE